MPELCGITWNHTCGFLPMIAATQRSVRNAESITESSGIRTSWQACHSGGVCHANCQNGGHQRALAIDAATPVCGYRGNLLERAGAQPPRTWTELEALAEQDLGAIPAIGIHSLLNFCMLCDALGEGPFAARNRSGENGWKRVARHADGDSLDGRACSVRDGLFLSRRLGHVGRLGVVSDLHDHDRQRVRRGHRGMERRNRSGPQVASIRFGASGLRPRS